MTETKKIPQKIPVDLPVLAKDCLAAALLGAAVCKKYYLSGSAKVYEKKTDGFTDIFTAADIESEKVILSFVKKKYPLHSIISEEAGGNNDDGFCWFIDPLDGTHNFAKGLPIFGVSVGVAYKYRPIAGAIILPVLNTEAHAFAGGGAFINGKKASVTKNTRLEESMVMLSSKLRAQYAKPILDTATSLGTKCKALRITGCAVFDLVQIAQGHADAAIFHSTTAWDACAGAILVEEAGGLTLGLSNTPWTTEESGIIVAANSELLKKLY
jgi:myo-inositol-1(or 4)-monophosphatase